MIDNYDELYQAIGVSSQEGLEKAIYKGTKCGARCSKLECKTGVLIGSIVEGVDGDGTEYHKLFFPFDEEKFWAVVQAVDDEADEIWNEFEAEQQILEQEHEFENKP